MNIDNAVRSAEWKRISADLRRFLEQHFGDCPKQIIVPFPYLGEGRFPLALPSSSEPPPVTPLGPYPRRRQDPYHTADFQLVRWQGREWTFSVMQRAVVKRLWEAWDSGNPEVAQRTLLDVAGSECAALRDLFRDHGAWGTLIVRAGPTIYRLAIQRPEEMEDATGTVDGEDPY